ncbi:uncharacterized protein LOC110691356 [Chenopodium quinoa]|uniref:uncharacterized protein LOC110691356 n=1 Tax=Chenopodium quinoa TaxID=63459 RepID=UPI000B792826|nr:uncharacterized protein LOC110691356 [Chenopodium quinoa]
MSRLSNSRSRCHCGLLVSKSRAWTRDNPGRRFLACPDYDAKTDKRSCKFFKWDPNAWQTEVILGLMQEKQELKNEVMSMRKELKQVNKYARKIESDYVMLKVKRAARMNLGINCDLWKVVIVLHVLGI